MSRTGTMSGWRYFPHAMVGAIGLMVVVDSGLAWTALHSFPGVAATDVFDHSNSYDAVLAIAEREAALGWTLKADVQDSHPVVLLSGRDGAGLHGAAVVGTAERPLGAANAAALTFREASPGRYVADAALALPGQWDLKLEAKSGNDSVHATRRLIVK